MRTLKLTAVALCAALVVVAPFAGVAGAAAPPTAEAHAVPKAVLPSLAPIVRRVLPAVVSVSAAEASEAEAVGSGFIIDPAGEIVTNNHVIEGAKSIKVTLRDGSTYEAKVLGRDKETDLALLKIDAPEPLPFVGWGDSGAVEVGDWVVAIGNPFDLGGTVTAGIVSALDRSMSSSPYNDFIQVDAPINKGNSGGPTFNMSGVVIGVNTAIYSPSGGSVGIGFDIPSNVAQGITRQLREHGRVARGWLGAKIQSVTPILADSFGLADTNGALVAAVVPGGPAEAAGIKQGDVIVSVNDHPIKKPDDVMRRMAAIQPEQGFWLMVARDGYQQVITATAGDRSAIHQSAAVAPRPGERKETAFPSLGLAVAPLDSHWRDAFHIPENVHGMVVSSVAPKGFAAGHGFKEGDVIERINRKSVTSYDEGVADLLRQAATGKVALLLNRDGVERFVGLSVPTQP